MLFEVLASVAFVLLVSVTAWLLFIYHPEKHAHQHEREANNAHKAATWQMAASRVDKR